MAVGFPTKANWAAGDVLTAAQMDDLAGTVNTLAYVPSRNPVLNSNFSVWQRGISISVAASTTNQYVSDRWSVLTNANQACTISRQATGDTTNLPNIQYCLRYQRNSGQTGTAALYLAHSMETVNSIPFAGKNITISFYARAGVNYSASGSALLCTVATGTGTDQNLLTGYTGVAAVGGMADVSKTLTTTWQRFTISSSSPVAATATELGFYFNFAPTGTAGANDYFEITGVQLELGSTASTYYPNGNTYQAELAACRRYLPAFYVSSLVGYSYAANSAIYTLQFDTPARVAPTGITLSGTFNAYALNTSYSVTPLFNEASVNQGSLNVNSGLTITAGQGSRIAGGGLVLFTGCEL
jgi:hypothetical protein